LLHLTQEELRQAFMLEPNRVLRTYRGGLLLETFRGYAHPQDGWTPEDWLGSTTESRLKNHPHEGLSFLSVGDRKFTLDNVIRNYPREMLGEKHVEVFGPHPFLLAKLLDSCERLRVQVHPSRDQALALFGSRHGKAEAWHILDTRTIGGVEPYILLGFREGVRAQEFAKALLSEDTEALLSMMHRLEVKPGDTFMVDAGVPHAIGSGVFMLEIQEPSDLTVYAESSGDTPLEHPSNHLGLGWQNALGLFQYQGDSREANLAKRKLVPEKTDCYGASVYNTVMGDPAQPYFGLTEYVVRERTTLRMETYTIAIVVGGRGTLEGEDFRRDVTRGDVMFWPALLGELTLCAASERDSLTILCCRPPSHYF